MNLPEQLWNRLNLAWSGLFISLGILNLYVAWNFPTDTWVNFKLFGVTGIMFLFIIVQAVMLSKHLETNKEENI